MNLTHTITFFEKDQHNRTEIEIIVEYSDHDIQSVGELRETIYEDGCMVSNKLLDVKAWDSLGIIDKLIENVDWEMKSADYIAENFDHIFNTKNER